MIMKATQTTPSWITETPPPKPVEPETTNLGNPFGGMSKDVPSFVSTDGAASTPSVDDIALADTPQGGLIKTWSPTALQKFEACQWQVYLQRVKKIKQESGEAAQRGTNIHDQGEAFVRGELDPMPKTLMKFQKQFEYLREEFAEGRVLCEQDWGFTPDWEPVPVVWDKPQHWAMMKLDALHLQSETSARVIDYKGLPLDTPIPTPEGWSTMGDLQVGDYVFDMYGNKTPILGKSHVKNLPCFEIEFDDKSTIKCDEEHLWRLYDGGVKQVTELAVGDHLPIAKAIENNPVDLPIHPYLLGYWLGDGKHSSAEITIWTDIFGEVNDIFKSFGGELSQPKRIQNSCYTPTLRDTRKHLAELGLLCNKHIPDSYLFASKQQRIHLLRGLMDSDGSANPHRKQAVFCNSNKRLIDQVYELCASLGLRPSVSEFTAMGFGKTCTSYRICFRPMYFNPFILSRKANRIKWQEWGPGRSNRRRIIAINRIDSEPSQCIRVAAPTHTFLCGKQFCVTHNTGKKWGNEMKHNAQGQIYTIGTFMRYPKLEFIETEFWYLDKNEVLENTYTREQAMHFLDRLQGRAEAMTRALKFIPSPSTKNCQWCPYGINKGNGACDYAI